MHSSGRRVPLPRCIAINVEQAILATELEGVLATLQEDTIGNQIVGQVIDVGPKAARPHLRIATRTESSPAMIQAVAGAISGSSLDAKFGIEVLGKRYVERSIEFREAEPKFVEDRW